MYSQSVSDTSFLIYLIQRNVGVGKRKHILMAGSQKRIYELDKHVYSCIGYLISSILNPIVKCKY